MRRKRLLGTLAALALVLAGTAPLALAEPALPTDITAMLTLKVLTFDRNLEQRAGAEVVVALVYAEGDEGFADSLAKSFEGYSDKKINGIPFSVTKHAYADLAGLSAWADSAKPAVIFLSPGMKGETGSIHGLASTKKIMTAGPDGDFPAKGASLGFEVADGKPKIVINRDKSTEEGVDFSANLLSIAKVL